ncbi:MAG: hypothetical protein ACI4XP_00065 [Acutalibacteraceae bacterium]
MEIPRIKTKAFICLILFISGAIISVVLDIIGITSISTESVLNSSIHLPDFAQYLLPVVFIAAGLITGMVSKNNTDAVIYGLCVGQCQTLLPLIAFYFILHTGTDFEIWCRALCGLPLTASFAGIGFSLKSLLKNRKSK